MYMRYIKCLDEGLALFRIENTKEAETYGNYHIYYENGKKPPLDIAFSPRSNNIKYIKWFLQDEKIQRNKAPQISDEVLRKNSIKDNYEFTPQKWEIFAHKEFLFQYNHKGIYVVDTMITDLVVEFPLDCKNSLLLNKDGAFVGLFWKNLTVDEMQNLLNAKAF